jgi:CMP-N-acetylneuraminic acid synthetase
MGVSEYALHPYKSLEQNQDGFLRPLFPDQFMNKSQTYPHLVASNGSFYWVKVSAFLNNPTFYLYPILPYELPWNEALDIDTPQDFEKAKEIWSMRKS